MKYLIFLIAPLFFIFSCSRASTKRITNKDDFAHILETLSSSDYMASKIQKNQGQIDFWNSKLEKEPSAYIYKEKIATLLNERFSLTRDITNVIESDILLEEVAMATTGKYKARTLLSRSSNAVKLHDFSSAKEFSTEALDHSVAKEAPSLMVFDAAMELGDYEQAGNILEVSSEKESFGYLIRLGKYLDYQGDLSSAIEVTEQARKGLKNVRSQDFIWVSTHLADMYGHDGRIEKSYQQFLEVLALEPFNLHALRGIAWIAYSHDKDSNMALEILHVVNDVSTLPDPLLLMAELAEKEGYINEKEAYINEFLDKVANQKVEKLYRGYVAELSMTELGQKDLALTLAQKECSERPTPANYSLLAKALFANNQFDKATEIIKSYVFEKTYEPAVLSEIGIILANAGETILAKNLIQEALEASFELGPMVTKELEETLKKIG